MSHLRKFSEREHWVEHINRPFVTGASNTDFKAKLNENNFLWNKNEYFVENKIKMLSPASPIQILKQNKMKIISFYQNENSDFVITRIFGILSMLLQT